MKNLPSRWIRGFEVDCESLLLLLSWPIGEIPERGVEIEFD